MHRISAFHIDHRDLLVICSSVVGEKVHVTAVSGHDDWWYDRVRVQASRVSWQLPLCQSGQPRSHLNRWPVMVQWRRWRRWRVNGPWWYQHDGDRPDRHTVHGLGWARWDGAGLGQAGCSWAGPGKVGPGLAGWGWAGPGRVAPGMERPGWARQDWAGLGQAGWDQAGPGRVGPSWAT